MNVLITGSSGQIGSNLALALIARGDSVLGVDNSYGLMPGHGPIS